MFFSRSEKIQGNEIEQNGIHDFAKKERKKESAPFFWPPACCTLIGLNWKIRWPTQHWLVCLVAIQPQRANARNGECCFIPHAKKQSSPKKQKSLDQRVRNTKPENWKECNCSYIVPENHFAQHGWASNQCQVFTTPNFYNIQNTKTKNIECFEANFQTSPKNPIHTNPDLVWICRRFLDKKAQMLHLSPKIVFIFHLLKIPCLSSAMSFVSTENLSCSSPGDLSLSRIHEYQSLNWTTTRSIVQVSFMQFCVVTKR